MNKLVGSGLIILGIILLVMFSLIKADLDKRDAFLCQAVHSNPNVDPTKCPVHTSNTSWWLLAGYVVSVLVTLSGVYLIFVDYLFPEELKKLKKRTESPAELTKPDLSTLNEEEQRVYSLLREHQGSMYQSELITALGWSKVQVTRVLDKLEGKKIIERKRRGMTNVVIVR